MLTNTIDVDPGKNCQAAVNDGFTPATAAQAPNGLAHGTATTAQTIRNALITTAPVRTDLGTYLYTQTACTFLLSCSLSDPVSKAICVPPRLPLHPPGH